MALYPRLTSLVQNYVAFNGRFSERFLRLDNASSCLSYFSNFSSCRFILKYLAVQIGCNEKKKPSSGDRRNGIQNGPEFRKFLSGDQNKSHPEEQEVKDSLSDIIGKLKNSRKLMPGK